MAIRGDEIYVTIQGRLKRITPRAINIEVDGLDGWVPRSCIHFSTDKAVDDMSEGDEGEFKIMEWVASDRGFV